MKKYKVEQSGPIFCSPDNGKTVFIQRKNGNRTKVFEDPTVKYDRQAQRESYLSDAQACHIRDKYPALKDAWQQYKTIWELTVTDDDLNYPYY
jgi:hypothetical protein